MICVLLKFLHTYIIIWYNIEGTTKEYVGMALELVHEQFMAGFIFPDDDAVVLVR